MRKPTAEELRVLTTFFRTAAAQLGLYDRAAKSLNQSHPLFQSNLEILRSLAKKKVNLKKLEANCRTAYAEGRRLTRIDEVAPELMDEAQMESLDRNLLRDSVNYLHRKLRIVSAPVTRMTYGYTSNAQPESLDFSIRRADTFTMRDLIQFYCEMTGEHYTEAKAKALIGPFNYLLGISDLDTILFCIDHAACNEDIRVSNPLDLQKLTEYADDEIRGRRGHAI